MDRSAQGSSLPAASPGRSRGFTCHPCMGFAIGLFIYGAVALPLVGEYAKLSGAPAPWFAWGLLALGCILYAASGLAVWEANLLVVLAGWATGYGVAWLLGEAGVERMAQVLVLLALPQAAAAAVLVHAFVRR